MATSVGEIGLDLVINQKQYNKQLSGITSLAKKAGVALAAAFTVKKLIDFGAQAVELGSDLNEVQNVVDVTFPKMSAQVDAFAKSAAGSFGLSETMAKKFTGTFGAMAKAFGFSESAAYDMGTTLTGLSGDVASFYNISQDEAYTKLKSVFTGETESLKDLGVVMTQNALDAYALANGYGKTTSSMSEAEKVALRYAFVQNQLSAASGDFIRTSDSWANQVRVMKLQMQSFMATVGQGLINIFTPVIHVINTVIGKLMGVASAFKSFTELITGKKSSVSSTAATAASGLSDAATAADSLTDATNSAGSAAKQAAKDMKALMGFDQINKLGDDSDTGTSAGTSAGSTSSTGVDATASDETAVNNTSAAVDKLIEKANLLKAIFSKGFQIGFGNSEKNISKIKGSLGSIGTNLKDIFTSSDVISSAAVWAGSVVKNTGKVTGSIAKTGIAIATNLTGGVAQALDEKKNYIKEKVSSLFILSGKTWNVLGDFSTALGDIISSALTNKSAIDITSDIGSMLITGVLGAEELLTKAGLDLISVIAQPIIDNKGKIETAISNTLAPVATNIGVVKTAFEDAFSVIGKVYDAHVSPMLSAFKGGISDSFGKVLDAYNTYVAPALQAIADKFESIYEPQIKPVLTKMGALIGVVADTVKELYVTWFKPFFDWCVQNILPVLAPIFETLGTGAVAVFGFLCDAIGGIIDVLTGVITFIKGVFTGDWQTAWQGIQGIFSGIAEIIKGIWNGIKTAFSTVLSAIKQLFSPIGSWFSARCASIKNAFSGIPDWFSKKFSAAYTKVTSAFSSIGSWFSSRYTDVKNAFTGISSWFSSTFGNAWKQVTAAFSSVGSFFSGVWSTITGLFTNIGQAIGNSIAGAFKSAINAVLATAETVLNTPINAINGMISKIPFLKGIGKLDTFNLPRLAQGGYVKKNTPQLAMIGDNRHQGEVVAPEDKLTEMAMKAASMAGSGGGLTSEVITLLREIIELLKQIDPDITLDGEKVTDKIVKRINTKTKATGKCPIVT